MRFMVIVKADKSSEAGVMPSRELLTAMGKFNEELVKAGVMLAGEGLHPSSKGKRVRFSGGKQSVIDGPFTETKELIAGFWLWQVRSMEEAVEWLKRSPFDGGAEVEIRQVFETEDFGAEMTPELREQEARLRAQTAKKKSFGGAPPSSFRFFERTGWEAERRFVPATSAPSARAGRNLPPPIARTLTSRGIRRHGPARSGTGYRSGWPAASAPAAFPRRRAPADCL